MSASRWLRPCRPNQLRRRTGSGTCRRRTRQFRRSGTRCLARLEPAPNSCRRRWSFTPPRRGGCCRLETDGRPDEFDDGRAASRRMVELSIVPLSAVSFVRPTDAGSGGGNGIANVVPSGGSDSSRHTVGSVDDGGRLVWPHAGVAPVSAASATTRIDCAEARLSYILRPAEQTVRPGLLIESTLGYQRGATRRVGQWRVDRLDRGVGRHRRRAVRRRRCPGGDVRVPGAGANPVGVSDWQIVTLEVV